MAKRLTNTFMLLPSFRKKNTLNGICWLRSYIWPRLVNRLTRYRPLLVRVPIPLRLVRITRLTCVILRLPCLRLLLPCLLYCLLLNSSRLVLILLYPLRSLLLLGRLRIYEWSPLSTRSLHLLALLSRNTFMNPQLCRPPWVRRLLTARASRCNAFNLLNWFLTLCRYLLWLILALIRHMNRILFVRTLVPLFILLLMEYRRLPFTCLRLRPRNLLDLCWTPYRQSPLILITSRRVNRWKRSWVYLNILRKQSTRSWKRSTKPE